MKTADSLRTQEELGSAGEPTNALTSVVRDERTLLVAALVRRYGFDLAEECVDAAVEAALIQWSTSGVPASPRAWLLTVARRRAIDRVRHAATASQVHAAQHAFAEGTLGEPDIDAADFPDDRLRLVFTCCHPAIAREAQVALALRWLSGLSTEEVARAFCVSVDAMAARLVRAKTKIEAARIPYEVPERRELDERVASVLEVIYAIFNEGYVATHGDTLERTSLAAEALRLSELLCFLLPESGDSKALLALLLFIHARRGARVTTDGDLVRLEEQDRRRFDQDSIARAKGLLRDALVLAPPSTYAIEAAIQALHDEAPSYEQTDFAQIMSLYALLRVRTSAPIIDVNHAVARAMVEGPEAGLRDLLVVEGAGTLLGHPALPAAKADMYRRLGRHDDAARSYDDAIAATRNEAEKRFLARQKAALR